MEARYAGAEELADLVGQRFEDTRELTRAIWEDVLYILIGLLNVMLKLMFWNGKELNILSTYTIFAHNRNS
jgi:hypothetical protein